MALIADVLDGSASRAVDGVALNDEVVRRPRAGNRLMSLLKDFPMDAFLESTDVVDWRSESVASLARELSRDTTDEFLISRRTFEWVRDNIEHSVDFHREAVTCRASDVLAMRTGFCYAKSHLLAALMRANGIPAGFCYQRLSVNGEGSPYCLHGLNAVYLGELGWYRVDARGNTNLIRAQFSPPTEKLAFAVSIDGEADLPGVSPEPLSCVLSALTSAESVESLAADLPDIDPASFE